MIVYELIEGFIEAVKENKPNKLYINQNRNISKLGELSGNISICFFVENICHMLYYSEDIPRLPILTESTLQVAFSNFGKEYSDGLKAKYELDIKSFNDKMNQTEDTAKKVFAGFGCSFVKATVI
jgi:hypothetical protein